MTHTTRSMPRIFHILTLTLVAFGCISCQDDPELVRKRDEQRNEIARLQAELTLLEDKVKSLPVDRSRELAAAKTAVEEQDQKIADLEKELAEAEQRKAALEKEFAEYRSKYVLNSN